MQRTTLYRRLSRRELHRSRSVAVSVALGVFVVVLAWVGTEAVLALLHRPALLVAPQDAVDAALRPTGNWTAVVDTAGVVVVLVGIALLVLALAPGRRDRRAVPRERAVVLVDDRIVAATAANAARRQAGVPDGQVDAWVSRRRVGVRIVPTSGIPVDAAGVEAAVADRLAALDDTTPDIRVTVAEHGALS